jgi:FixJ family two-component response regulator
VIAIVDDDESVRTAMSDMVETFGFTARTFGSADEFLNSAALDDTACLILDVQMPGMSGLELYDRLNASGHRIPAMFVTAFHDARVHDRAMRAGAVCCLAKPFNRNELLTCIHSALDTSKPGRKPS